MKKIKVAIIDKDILARRALCSFFQADNTFQLAAVVGDINRVDDIIDSENPDVLLYNVDRLNSDEFSMFVHLRIQFTDLPIVVMAPRTETGAEAVMAALKMGAIDVVTKPESDTGFLFADSHLAKRAGPIVKNAYLLRRQGPSVILERSSPENYQQKFASRIPEVNELYPAQTTNVAVIGGCMGAPVELFNLIPRLPEELSIPVVIVQHFPKIYTRVLAHELNKQSAIEVQEAFDGAELVPGIVWITPGGVHSEIHRAGSKHAMIRTHRGARELNNRPSINALFRSAANVFDSRTLGIILSGCGRDGLKGAESIHQAGGRLLVQDPETAQVPALPLSIIRAGFANQYYSINDLLLQIVQHDDILKKKRKSKISGSRFRQIRQADKIMFNTL